MTDEAEKRLLAQWSLLMVGTALGAGLTEAQIRFAMQPKNLAAAIGICKKGAAARAAAMTGEGCAT